MSVVNDFKNTQVSILTATILSGQGISDAINLFGTSIGAIEFPAAFTATTLNFEGSIDGGATFKTVVDKSAVEIACVVAADTVTTLNVNVFFPYDQIKIVTPGSTEGADRTLKIKPFMV